MKSKIVAVENIKPTQIERLYLVFDSLYDNVSREEFERDLLDKDYIVLLFADSEIVGFSTIKVYREKGIHTIFSGDTAILKKYWGNKRLQIAFSRFLLTWMITHPFTRVYWLLISKGYKTYLLLANNISDFAPSIKRALTPDEKDIAYKILEKKYDEHLDRARGLLVFNRPSCHVKGEICSIAPDDLANRHIQFFAEKNPNHARGDELICLAQVRVRDMGLCMLRHIFRAKNKRPELALREKIRVSRPAA